VKFLFQDDLIHSHAVARLLTALETAPEAGFAFSRREVRYEGPSEGLPLLSPGRPPEVEGFCAGFRGRFDGIDLVRRGLREGWDLAVNVVGEPSFVLLRREAARRAGGFDARLRQLVDWDLWLRLAKNAPAVFVPEPLGVFRVHPRSQSAANYRRLRTIVECMRILRCIRRHFGPRLTAGERRRLMATQCRYGVHLAGEVLRSVPRVRARRAAVMHG
jgi:hypothetical protein